MSKSRWKTVLPCAPRKAGWALIHSLGCIERSDPSDKETTYWWPRPRLRQAAREDHLFYTKAGDQDLSIGYYKE